MTIPDETSNPQAKQWQKRAGSGEAILKRVDRNVVEAACNIGVQKPRKALIPVGDDLFDGEVDSASGAVSKACAEERLFPIPGQEPRNGRLGDAVAHGRHHKIPVLAASRLFLDYFCGTGT